MDCVTDQTYGSAFVRDGAPKYDIPANGRYSRDKLHRSFLFRPSKVTEQIIRDELNLDGNPRQNLASFVTTWMEPVTGLQ